MSEPTEVQLASGGERGPSGPARSAESGRGVSEAAESGKVDFDPFSDEFFDDPTEVYRRLRDEAPVYFSEKYGFYALSRFADVLAAHRDWQGFSSAHGIELFTLVDGPGGGRELPAASS